MQLIAFAASSSRQSINKRLVTHACDIAREFWPELAVDILDINDYEMPLFSVDREAELGHPAPAKAFLQKIGEADGLIISYAEHNGSYTAAWKSLYDWCSRIDSKVYQDKPVVLLATSPGGRGGIGVLTTASNSAPHFGAKLKGSLSIPNFNDNFDKNTGTINNPALAASLRETVRALFD